MKHTWVDLLEHVEGSCCGQLNGQSRQLNFVPKEAHGATINGHPASALINGQLWVQVDGLEVLVNGRWLLRLWLLLLLE